jgi:hypothetical protein
VHDVDDAGVAGGGHDFLHQPPFAGGAVHEHPPFRHPLQHTARHRGPALAASIYCAGGADAGTQKVFCSLGCISTSGHSAQPAPQPGIDAPARRQ